MTEKKFRMQEGKRRKSTPPPKPTVQFKMENGAVVATMEPGVTAEQVAAHREKLKTELEKPATELEKLLAEKVSGKEPEEICESPTPSPKE